MASGKSTKVVELQKPAKLRRGEARQHVLNVALERFSTVGFDGITTRGLAEACGVNHSLIIYHFGDKMGLWKAVMEEIFQSFQDRLAARTEGLGDLEPEVVLKLGIRDFVAFSKEQPALHRIMTIEGRERTERLDWLVKHYLQSTFDATVQNIKAAQARGKVRAGDPARLYYAILSIGGSAFAFAPEYNLLTDQEAQATPDVEEIVALIEHVIFVSEAE